jgi:hypothetical protein
VFIAGSAPSFFGAAIGNLGREVVDIATVKLWAEELAKLAPIGTMLIALIAATIALRSLRTQKDIARKRAALDLLLKLGTEKSLIDHRRDFSTAIAAHANSASRNEFEATDLYFNLRTLLEYYEILAVGINSGVVDEEVCFDCFASSLVDLVNEIEGFLAGESPEVLGELKSLSARWSKRLAKRDKKVFAKGIAPLRTAPGAL